MIGKKRLNRGQVWVETVIYTLIAFSMMGLVLAFAVPKIQETQDKGIIDQSIGVLQDIDTLIKNLGGPGNQRVIELGINKGKMIIDSKTDMIYFEIESKYQYSQPGENISVGRVIAYTKENGNINIVTLTLNYAGNYNITYDNVDVAKILDKAPVPYSLLISDNGEDIAGNTIVDMEVIG